MTDIVVSPVAIGLERIADRAGPLPLVSDSTIWALHGAPLRDRLPVTPLLIPEGEAGKTWAVLESLLERLAEIDPGRDTPIMALGGGSVGDVAGLAAALFKRGCPLVAIPTTLLAQADSSVGGKTAIDFAGTKNLVGTFHPPALVLADPSMLATLPVRHLRAGYAEVVKYGLIDDPPFFAWCEAEGAGLLAGHLPSLEHAIRHCLSAKARRVEGDLDDRTGQRMLLNFGHSFAHAIEAEAGLGRVLHGEAVAVGMVLAMALSTRLGLCPPDDSRRLERHLAAAGLPTRLGDLSVRGNALLPALRRDKKNVAGLTLILSRGIGRAFVARDVPQDALATFLSES